MAQEEWFKSAFSDDYIRIYAHRDQAEARAAIRSLTARLPIVPDGLYLDLCCGFARHLSYLNELGISSVGCDLSMDLMSHATDAVHGRLVQANMLHLPFQPGVFDGLFSFFTSFGYFDDDEANGSVIREMSRVLKPSGRVLIDFLNPRHVIDTLVPEDTAQLFDFHLTQHRWIDEGLRTVNKKMIIEDNAGSRTYLERVKLYGPEDFEAFFASAGLRRIETFGDPKGNPFTHLSPRQIMIAEKL